MHLETERIYWLHFRTVGGRALCYTQQRHTIYSNVSWLKYLFNQSTVIVLQNWPMYICLWQALHSFYLLHGIRGWCDSVLLLIYQFVALGTCNLHRGYSFSFLQLLWNQLGLSIYREASERTALSAKGLMQKAKLSQDPLFTKYSLHFARLTSPKFCFEQRWACVLLWSHSGDTLKNNIVFLLHMPIGVVEDGERQLQSVWVGD